MRASAGALDVGPQQEDRDDAREQRDDAENRRLAIAELHSLTNLDRHAGPKQSVVISSPFLGW